MRSGRDYLDTEDHSYQLDTASRGVTYREDAPLRMRMDQRNMSRPPISLIPSSEMGLYRIIRDYMGRDNFCKEHSKAHCKGKRGTPQRRPLGSWREIIKGPFRPG